MSYLYTRVQFNWNEVRYSIYSTYELLMNIIGMISLLLHNILVHKYKNRKKYRSLPANIDLPSLYLSLGLLFAVFVLSKKLNISDEIIGTLSTISQSLAALYYFFAYNAFLFYFGKHEYRQLIKDVMVYVIYLSRCSWLSFFTGPLVNILITAENMSIKSLMTKLAPNTEISKK